MSDLPEPEFSGWYPWSVLHGDPATVHELDDAGAFLLARFDGQVPELDVTDPAIFYIDEAEGPSRPLRLRIREFGFSAGFEGDQEQGHEAAWAYPDMFTADRLGRRTDSSKVYIALCAFPHAPWPRNARAVFPGLIAATSLWRYMLKHARPPVLNRSGSGQEVPAPPQVDSGVLQAVRARYDTAAAGHLLDAITVALGYAPNDPLEEQVDDEWFALERVLEPEWSLEVGWIYESVPPRVGIRIWHDDTLWFGEGTNEQPVASDEALRALIDLLWYRWHSEA